jgi:2-dehydro-3-deoxyphosphogalactonate aldolase
VVAILRTNNPEVALRRGIELADMGCTALEVTVDSVGFFDLVTRLRAVLGDRCLVGAGTVTNHDEVFRSCAFL